MESVSCSNTYFPHCMYMSDASLVCFYILTSEVNNKSLSGVIMMPLCCLLINIELEWVYSSLDHRVVLSFKGRVYDLVVRQFKVTNHIWPSLGPLILLQRNILYMGCSVNVLYIVAIQE